MADDQRVYISIFGDTSYRLKLRRTADRADHLQPVLLDIGADWIKINEEMFGTEGRRSGHPWRGLAFSTVKKRGSAHPILFDTGELFDEMVDPIHIRVTDSTLHMALSEYADRIGEYHQHGTVNMPARPIVNFTDMDRHHFTRKIRDFVMPGVQP